MLSGKPEFVSAAEDHGLWEVVIARVRAVESGNVAQQNRPL